MKRQTIETDFISANDAISPIKVDALLSLRNIQDRLDKAHQQLREKRMKHRQEKAARTLSKLKNNAPPELPFLKHNRLPSTSTVLTQEPRSDKKKSNRTPSKVSKLPAVWDDLAMTTLIDLLGKKENRTHNSIDFDRLALELSSICGCDFRPEHVEKKLREDFLKWHQRTEEQNRKYDDFINNGNAALLKRA